MQNAQHYLRLGVLLVLISTAGVAQTATTVSLSGSATNISLGRPLTLRATVTPVPSGGRVTFYDRVIVLGSANLNASGSASFTTTSLLPGGHRLRAIYTGNDLYGGGLSEYFVVVISSLGSSGFTKGVNSAISDSGQILVVADLNKDGIADIVQSRNEGFAALLGKGGGQFQSGVNYDTGAFGHPVIGLAVADLRGTGAQDVVVSDGVMIHFFWNDGHGAFTQGTSIRVGAGIIKVADFNRDGVPDLAFIGGTSFGVSVYLGNGDGTFRPFSTALLGEVPVDFDIADFDLDGTPDIVFRTNTHFTDISVSIGLLLNEGGGHFRPPTYLGIAAGAVLPNAILAYDFNRDGRPDVASFTPNSASIFLGDGKGGFGTGLLTGVDGSGSFGKFLASDINGDGKPDLLVLSNPGLYLLYGNSDGTFGPPITVDLPFSVASAAGDFDGDGRLDLAFLTSPDGVNAFLQVLLGAKLQ